MNIFGIGELELVLIVVIALIVAGPKRMIQWMYVLGRWVARMRQMWTEAAVILQRELNEAGVEVEVPKDMPTRGGLRNMAQNATQKAFKPFSEPVQDAVNEIKSVRTELQTTGRQAREQVDGIRADLRGNGKKTPVMPTVPTNPIPPTTPTETNPSENSFGTWSGTDNQ